MAVDLASLRQVLAGRLPLRIHAALEAYETFAATEPPADAKGFAAWHAAAKAALAHVDLLLKLAGWAEVEIKDGDEDGLASMLAQARAALAELDDQDGAEEE